MSLVVDLAVSLQLKPRKGVTSITGFFAIYRAHNHCNFPHNSELLRTDADEITGAFYREKSRNETVFSTK